jgi:ABC-type multidrug transport system permease subunit
MMRILDEVIITSSSGSDSVHSEPSTASNNIGFYIGIIVGAVVILVGVALLIYFLNIRKK